MKSGEKGFTLVELLVAVAIMVCVSTAAGAGIIQIQMNTERNSNHMAAVLQVQNADQQISQDAKRAQCITAENLTSPEFLILTWIDGDNGDEYQVTYTLEDMPENELKTMWRNQSINGTADTTMLVAQYIDSAPEKTSCNLTSGILTLTITATYGRGSKMESESRTYQVVPRPG